MERDKTFKIVDGDISDGYHTFNELYEHRHLLMLTVMNMTQSSWYSSKHHDGSSFPGWFIAGINLSSGPITYHLPEKYWVLAGHTKAMQLETAPKWDGHTSGDVLLRLKKAIAVPD
jgi:hypothetical protein